jgi:hypothetical protein
LTILLYDNFHSQDLLERAFEFCGAACGSAASVAVARAADVLQALVPPSTPRSKVETAVKGALALLVLALVKGVLSVSAFCGFGLHAWFGGRGPQQQRQP